MNDTKERQALYWAARTELRQCLEAERNAAKAGRFFAAQYWHGGAQACERVMILLDDFTGAPKGAM